jgi:hypothetical protein
MKHTLSEKNMNEISQVTDATKPIALLRQLPSDFTEDISKKFNQGFDDLDYLEYSCIDFSSKYAVTLINHKNSPIPGTEICVTQYNSNVGETVKDVLNLLDLSIDDLYWIHPDYVDLIRSVLHEQQK